ncbi:hypothetical protein QMA09_15785 [Planococcus sp. APC 3906]|uniref:hypothetical protein n=1 Tax=Planococcus sp. APC 3906 TaxID=3035194 RepID=UPI0025B40EBF|nr:hypothetical protein [Planococcus sp. APC 3906]MDN3451660.1 hypothetical protein [Planococcus sp. APC 3906]
MEVTSLYSLIEVSEEEGVLAKYLSSFHCEKNSDVESFLHNKAVNNEKRSFTRTFLVTDETKDNDIIGYFTLMVKPFNILSNVSRGTRLSLANDKQAEVFNTILIAQLGRADSYIGIVSGKEILELALQHCELLNRLSALRIVCVEYDDVAVLNQLYENAGFKFLQISENGLKLGYLRI